MLGAKSHSRQLATMVRRTSTPRSWRWVSVLLIVPRRGGMCSLSGMLVKRATACGPGVSWRRGSGGEGPIRPVIPTDGCATTGAWACALGLGGTRSWKGRGIVSEMMMAVQAVVVLFAVAGVAAIVWSVRKRERSGDSEAR